MKNKKTHNYILYLVKKINKKYNRNIILYYNPKCIRSNIIYNKKKDQYLFTYGDRLITNAMNEKSHYRDYLRYLCFHEFGHIYHNTDKYETLEEKAKAEYDAERFCLNYLKENYHTTYIWACKEGYSLLSHPEWAQCKREKHYRIAWEKIEEYN